MSAGASRSPASWRRRNSRATCAAAPATGRSSTPRSRWRRCRQCRGRRSGRAAQAASAAASAAQAAADRPTWPRDRWPQLLALPAPRTRRRRSWPAAPTSACGSPRCTCSSRRCWTSPASRELRRIEDYAHHIAIGAAVTLTDAFDALVARAAAAQDLRQPLRRPAGAQLRHAGRQRRQRLADRRLDAAADRAGRAAWC